MTSKLSRSVLFLVILITGVVDSATIALLDERETDTLLGREGDEGVLASTNDENVGETGGERVATGVLDVSDLVGTGMVLDVLEHTDATNIVTASAENAGAVFELDNGINLAGLKVELDGVVDLDVGVGETDGPAVVGDDVGDLVLANALLAHLA